MPSGSYLSGNCKDADKSGYRSGDQCFQEDIQDWKIVPEIMIPLVGEVKELAIRERIGC